MAGTEVIYFPFGLQLPRRQDFPARFRPEPVAKSPPLAIRLPQGFVFLSAERLPFCRRLPERIRLNESGCLCRDVSVEPWR